MKEKKVVKKVCQGERESDQLCQILLIDLGTGHLIQ